MNLNILVGGDETDSEGLFTFPHAVVKDEHMACYSDRKANITKQLFLVLLSYL